MSTAFTGEGKTDAKDAYVIAQTARLRRDLNVVDRVAAVVRDLDLLTGHRADLIADRVRMINRLRDVMTSVFPSLERAFDYASCKGALVLLTGYASPDKLRRAGEARLTEWLKRRRVRDAAGVAARRGDGRPVATPRAVRAGCRRRHHRRTRDQPAGPGCPGQATGRADR